MKKNLLLVLSMSIILFSCKSAEINKFNFQSTKFKDGIYTGYAKHLDEATVQIKIENKKITEVKLLKFVATHFGQKAKDSIPNRIMAKQSPYVDSVTGATEGSNVIINAAVDALKKATE